jgi:hypothetical protein
MVVVCEAAELHRRLGDRCCRRRQGHRPEALDAVPAPQCEEDHPLDAAGLVGLGR